jgi:uncharacterized protein
MRVDLQDLSLRGGERHQAVHALELAPIMLGGVRYEVLLPRGVDVVVDRVAGGYLVDVSAEARVYGPCARCLAEVTLDIHGEEQEFVPRPGGEWDQSDLSPFISGSIVDLEGLTREAIVLSMPEQLLCSASCRGLCARCGADLNQGPCACDALEIS